MKSTSSLTLGGLVFASLLCGAISACSRNDPPPQPPDYIKAQQEAMRKAKNVEKEIMKSDQNARKAEDEGSK